MIHHHYCLDCGDTAESLNSAGEETRQERVQDVIWHDVQADGEELDMFLNGTPLPPDLREAAQDRQPFPEATPFAGGVLLRLPLRHSWEAEKAVYVTLVVCPQQLITLHREPALQLDEFRLRLERGEAPEVRTVPALLAFLIDGIVEMNIQQLNRARAQGEAISERIDDDPLSVGESEVLLIRRRVSRLAGQFEDQFYGLTSLQTLHSATFLPAFPGTALKDALDAQGHLARSIMRLETRLRDLQQHCAYVLQGRTERRVRLLAVLSAIFMPLNLITGLYGMNFSVMPGIAWEYGYFATLFIMIGLTGALLALFYRKGWLH